MVYFIKNMVQLLMRSDRMFTYIKAKNYKSLSDIELNLLDKKKQPKKLAIIYGENGSGKSNVANLFYTLLDTLRTMRIRDIINEYLENNSEDNPEEFLEMIRNNFKDTERIIKNNKMINSKGNMILEYGFIIDNNKGNYILELDENRIVKEELNFTIDKNKGRYFKLEEKCKPKLNSKIFITNEYYNETLLNIEKFWGKHSLLSILVNEMQDKSNDYIKNQLNKNMFKIIRFFNDFSCMVKVGNRSEKGKIGYTKNLLENLEEGKISIKEEDILRRTEEFLNEFFTMLYADIKSIYYNTEKDGEELKYKLYCRKMISDEIKDIDFDLESTGTQQLLALIPFIISAVGGKTVIIDEFDSGIHDLLIKNLLISIGDSIEGQLIMTTHNTAIMESEINKDSLYVINVTKDGEKEINCISDLEGRVHPNYNIRNRYLQGLYNGVPSAMYVDFEELLEILKE